MEEMASSMNIVKCSVYPSGGNNGTSSIFNYLKYYSPDVYGGSLGHHLVELPESDYWEEDVLNGAQSNAASGDTMYQAKALLKRLQKSSVDMKNDWKLVHILIGANDACPICDKSPRPSLADVKSKWKNDMNELLQFIYENFPKTLVDIDPQFNVSGVYNISQTVDYCFWFHDIIPIECPCAFKSSKEDRDFMDAALTVYREASMELAQEWQAKQLPEFTVITQTFTLNVTIHPSWVEYLSTLDCFHPNRKAHALLSIASWNALITPQSEKKFNWDPNDHVPLKCATNESRLFTPQTKMYNKNM